MSFIPLYGFPLYICLILLGFPGGSVSKEFACNAGDLGSIPGLGSSAGGGNGNPLQYSCGENPHGQRSLAGCSPRGRRESDKTERLSIAQSFFYYWTLFLSQFFTITSNLQWKTVYFYLILFRFLGLYIYNIYIYRLLTLYIYNIYIFLGL